MNWIEINEKCPKAFLEYIQTISGDVERVTGMETIPYNGSYRCRVVNKSNPLVSKMMIHYHIPLPFKRSILILPDYFDRFGVYVEVYRSRLWRATVESNGETYVINQSNPVRHYPDRISATAAGIAKAFEIREEQLSRIKNQ